MRKNTLNKLILLLLLPLLFSCRAKKLGAPPVAVDVPVESPALVIQTPASAAPSKTDTFDKIKAKQINFKTISLRAKADLDIDNKSNNVTMNIKMEKDKAIWISVTALVGLEVARVLITPDSIKIRDNINSNYIKKPFSYIYEFTNKQLNFNTLQVIFAGNSMSEFLNESSEIVVKDKTTSISGSLSDLMYALAFDENFKVTQTNLKDAKAKQELTVSYGDFGSISGQIIPQAVTVKSAVANKNIGVDLKYSRIELDAPVDMPFSVPSRFKVKE